MQVYVVGGAVRDVLLGRTPKDIDFVHVGATPADMVALGMEQVGAAFPVFLDANGNEHALARMERKVGAGYKGFDVVYDPTVTLEQDLIRRDLTINAMAVPVESWDAFVKTRDYKMVVDPYGGIGDLKWGILRHVSEAFAEDPVRVLRVARFSARYDFQVSDETLQLMKNLVASGELDNLTPERVWQEVFNAVTTTASPARFFEVLRTVGADARLWPELGSLVTDVCNAVSFISSHHGSDAAKFGAVGFAARSEAEDIVLRSWLERMKAPTDVVRVVAATPAVWDELVEGSLYAALEVTNAFSTGSIFSDVCQALENTLWFSNPSFSTNIERLDALKAARAAAMLVNFNSLSAEEQATLKGPAIGQAVAAKRQQVIKTFERP